jgi:tRNA threonylcarbamoyl adenosine modification protein YeaZ
MLEKQYGLAIHTTTRELGLAISNFNNNNRFQVWELGYELSNCFHEYLSKFILPQTWQELAFVAVAAGPGGFTGTRIGMVTARTLAQQLNIPLFAMSTLAAVAWSQQQNGTMIVKMSARRGQFFVGIYQKVANELKIELSDTIMTAENWLKMLETKQKDYHIIEAEGDLGNSVNAILELAFLQWKQGKNPLWYSALPFYGQQPVD